MSFERQRDFVNNTWSFLKDTSSVRKVGTLPGREAPITNDNTLVVEKKTPLSGFEFLPQGNEFVCLWGRAPHTLIRVGKTGLLAVLEYGKSRPMKQELLIPLAHDRLMAPIELTGNRLHINRTSLAELYESAPGINLDGRVSREKHASVNVYGDKVIISDEGSSNGTGYAIEDNKLMPPGSPYRPDPQFSAIMEVAGFEPQFFSPLGKNDNLR